MNHTLSKSIVLARRSGSRARTALKQLDADATWFQRLVTEELRSRPGRLRISVRMALIGAVGATVMVTLHVSGPVGPLAIWVALFASNRQMTAREAVSLLAMFGAATIAAVGVAGALLDAPWLLLPVLGLTTALVTYGLIRRGLAGPWFIARIGVLDTFFLAVFDPEGFGWAAANSYAGVALAVAVLLAFDAALWPDPAERRLFRSLAHTLDRECRRLSAIVRVYVDPDASAVLPEPDFVTIVPAQLPLLERARRELDNPQRDAERLAAVVTTERLHLEIERLLVIARAGVPRDIRARLAPDIEDVLAAIVVALRHAAQQATAGSLPGDPAQYEEVRTPLRASLESLRTHAAELPATIPNIDVVRAAPVAAFVRGLRKIGELLDRPLGSVESAAFPDVNPVGATPSARADTSFQYSAKLGLAVTLGYVVGVASHRSDLAVIMWIPLIAGQPTYGATLHRTILYVVGAVIGGVLTLAAIIVVSPNSESIGAYLAAFFVVLFICSYVALSSGRLAYAGSQAGVTFMFTYYALSPNDNAAEPLWRLWGILLGLGILSAVFLLVEPSYAGKAFAPRLSRLLRSALELLRPDSGQTESRIRAIGMDATQQLTQLLEIAQDARLEGRHSQLRPDGVIDAAGTLRRILQRLGALAIGRLVMPHVALPPDLDAARSALDAGLRMQLQAWLDAVERVGAEQHVDRRVLLDAAARVRAIDLAVPMVTLHDRVSATVLAQPAAWPAEVRSILLAELATYHGLLELMSELDDVLTQIPAPASRVR